MSIAQFTAKWKMIDSRHFTAEKEGYVMQVNLTVRGAPTWYIYKDGVAIDGCYCYPPTKCELSARIQAERCLNKILNNPINMSEKKSIHCYLTDHELAAKADQLIDELIKSGGKSFTMHVPARPNADPDLIFAELNNRFKKLITAAQPGAVWIKASIVPGKREIDYWCKLKSKKTGIEIRGAVLFSNSGVWVTDYEVLEYLDEGTAAGREEDVVALFEELWDEHSEYIDDDIDSLSRWVGSTVVDKEQFKTIVAKLYELFKQQKEK